MNQGERLLRAYERLGFDVEPARQALAEVAANPTDPPPPRRDKQDERTEAERVADRGRKRKRSAVLRLEELQADVIRQTKKIDDEFYFDMDVAGAMARLGYRHPAFIILATLHHARDLRHAGQVQRSTPVSEASAHSAAAAHVAQLRAHAAELRAADPPTPGPVARLGTGSDSEHTGDLESLAQGQEPDHEDLRELAPR